MGRRITLALGGLVAAVWAMTACAQTPVAYPQRNVQIVVPYTPGTGADIAARALGPRLAERWKVAVVTDNRAGATGTIGADFVARAAPDGHVVLMTATSFVTVPALNPKLPFDPLRSFAPVIQVAASELSVIVHPALPVRSMRDFVALAKRRPGQLHYSSPGNGGPQHLATELLKLETGIDIVHVPYKGASGAITDLMAGNVQAMVSAIQTITPQVRSGKLRMLATMGKARSEVFPMVPTLREQGLKNLEVETWYGMFAPAATPSAVIAKLNADLNAALQLPELRSFFTRQNLNVVGGSPEAFGQMVARELARWARVVQAAKITPD